MFLCFFLVPKSVICSVLLNVVNLYKSLLTSLISPLLTLAGSKPSPTRRPARRPPARTSAPSSASSSATPASWRSMPSSPVTWATLSRLRQEALDSLASVYTNLHGLTSSSERLIISTVLSVLFSEPFCKTFPFSIYRMRDILTCRA